MSLRVADKSASTQLWNSKMFFPTNNYTIRVVDEVNKPSSKGNPMTTIEFEIVNSEPVKMGDLGMVEFDGVTFKKFFTTGNPNNKELDQKSFNRHDDFLRKCGIDTSEGWDNENPPSVNGKVLSVKLYGKETIQRASPTDEEKQSNDPEVKKGKILIDPITNKEVRGYQIELGDVYGLFTGEVRPF